MWAARSVLDLVSACASVCVCMCVCEAVSNQCVSSIFNAFDHSPGPPCSLRLLSLRHILHIQPYPGISCTFTSCSSRFAFKLFMQTHTQSMQRFSQFAGSPGRSAKRRYGRRQTRKEASPRASAPVRIQLAATVIKAIVL